MKKVLSRVALLLVNLTNIQHLPSHSWGLFQTECQIRRTVLRHSLGTQERLHFSPKDAAYKNSKPFQEISQDMRSWTGAPLSAHAHTHTNTYSALTAWFTSFSRFAISLCYSRRFFSLQLRFHCPFIASSVTPSGAITHISFTSLDASTNSIYNSNEHLTLTPSPCLALFFLLPWLHTHFSVSVVWPRSRPFFLLSLHLYPLYTSLPFQILFSFETCTCNIIFLNNARTLHSGSPYSTSRTFTRGLLFLFLTPGVCNGPLPRTKPTDTPCLWLLLLTIRVTNSRVILTPQAGRRDGFFNLW